MEIEDIRWRQRAKRHWYKDGDQNTKFFHAWANQRRKSNSIKKLNDAEGNCWTSQEGIGRAFSSYFKSLFSSTGSEDLKELLEVVQPWVTQEMNNILTSPFLPEKVDFALSQMQPLKAPGPNGFGVCFYQQHWAIVGNLVRKMVLDFMNLGLFDPSLNFTYIALIPKLSQFVDVTNHLHISLCNVLYKIIAKVLANRLFP